MLRIRITGKFDDSLKDLLNSEPELENTIKQRIKLFRINPQDTRLDNHLLTGRLKGKWAFGITEDIRIVYEWLGKTNARFLAIGPHIIKCIKNHQGRTNKGTRRKDKSNSVLLNKKLSERMAGFEPVTSSLGRKHSTAELHPRAKARDKTYGFFPSIFP